MTPIRAPDGGTIGFVEYHQRRRGDVLQTIRVAHFADGSSDEDQAEARVGAELQALRGRSVIRDTRGRATVDLEIDVVAGRLTGFTDVDGRSEDIDERVNLPAGTYWGPLIFIVLKNFEPNASDGRLVFRTVAPTPRPLVLDMELVRLSPSALRRPGRELDVERFTLRPTIHWTIDPLVRLIAPETEFLVRAGEPPALARFAGPRNYGGQEIRLE